MQSHRVSMPSAHLQPHAELAFRLAQYLSIATQSPTSEKLLELGISTPSELLDVVCAMATNSFTAAASDLSPLGVSLCPTAALLNHSCRPNAVIVFPEGARGKQMDDVDAMRLVAIREIKPGEEVSQVSTLMRIYALHVLSSDAFNSPTFSADSHCLR